MKENDELVAEIERLRRAQHANRAAPRLGPTEAPASGAGELEGY